MPVFPARLKQLRLILRMINGWGLAGNILLSTGMTRLSGWTEAAARNGRYPMEMYNPCADYAGSFIAVADFGGKTGLPDKG